MIRPGQIPRNVITELARAILDDEGSVEDSMVAALNAWPEMRLMGADDSVVYLPLVNNIPAAHTDDKRAHSAFRCSMSDIVERLRDATDRDAISDAIEEIIALRSKVESQSRALRPFAEVARVFDPDMRGSCLPTTGEWYAWPRLVNGAPYDFHLTVEHLREARAALEGTVA